MKVRIQSLSNKDRINYLDALYTAASGVRGRVDVKAFLRDLLTPGERIMLGRRISIARRIIAGEGYDAIAASMRVGKDTIRRVHRWLLDQSPGYEKALAGLEREYEKRTKRSSIDYNTLIGKFKRKYPLHFLLFRWPRKRVHQKVV